MKVIGELKQKTFVTDKGEAIPYHVLSIPLIDGTCLELSIKGDKAKILLMSLKLSEQK